MKGLLLKDFIYVRRLYLKIILLMFGFYLLLALFSAGEGMDSFTASSALIAIFSIFPLATFTLDKAAHWDRYALSGPVDRRMLVLSKYIFSWCAVLAGAAVSLLYFVAAALIQGGAGVAEFWEVLQFVFNFSLAGLFFSSAMLPCVYRFGPEKARIFMFALVGVPFAAALVVKKLHIPAPSEEFWGWLAAFVPVLSLLAAYLSYRLSLYIFSKQEID